MRCIKNPKSKAELLENVGTKFPVADQKDYRSSTASLDIAVKNSGNYVMLAKFENKTKNRTKKLSLTPILKRLW